jgi:hypothetical protein
MRSSGFHARWPPASTPPEPMDLANMRHNGVRSLAVHCHQCRHEVIMNVDHLPGDLTHVGEVHRLHGFAGTGQ